MDEVYGEIPVAFVVTRHGSTLNQEDVMGFVAMQVSKLLPNHTKYRQLFHFFAVLFIKHLPATFFFIIY